MPEITVLSIKQPWANLILSGHKWAENRTWQTKYRGTLWIHASSCVPIEADYKAELEQLTGRPMVTGAILGCVELVDCLTEPELMRVNHSIQGEPVGLSEREQQIASLLPPNDDPSWDYWEMEKFAWILMKPRWLDVPVKAKGKLQLWKHPEIREAVTA